MMNPIADAPVATSWAGEIIVYFFFPLLVILAAGAIAAVLRLSRTVNEIRIELKPDDGSPSMRSMILDHTQRISRLEGRSDLSVIKGGGRRRD